MLRMLATRTLFSTGKPWTTQLRLLSGQISSPHGHGEQALKPVREKQTEKESVHVTRWLALAGICSRREADEYLMKGLVTIDGHLAGPGARVFPGQIAALDENALERARKRKFTFLLNKPVGYVSGQPRTRKQIPAVKLLSDRERSQLTYRELDRLSPLQYTSGLAPCGRLDIDSSGLLVLSSDGRIARRLIGDRDIDKEYLVKVEGSIIKDGLELLNHGLSLDDRPLKPAEVTWVEPGTLRFILREGRYRQIRRMCNLVGLQVVALVRIRIGKIKLDVPPGTWRLMGENESF